jgi:hypothetical protein
MKALTRDWLRAASLDLRAIEHLPFDECLTTTQLESSPHV